MNDKKIELISAKGAMGVTEFALLYFPESPPETAYKRMWVWIRTSRVNPAKRKATPIKNEKRFSEQKRKAMKIIKAILEIVSPLLLH